MNQKGITNVILVLVIVVIASAVLYFALVKKGSPVIPRALTPTSTPTQSIVTKSSTSIPTVETEKWETYRDDKYGISFKYPDDLKITENYYADASELKIDLISRNQQNRSSTEVMPKISISSTCLVPENVPKKYWEDGDFQNPPIALPIFLGLSGFLKTYEIMTHKLYVFNQGCYECYGGVDGPDLNTEYDGYSAYSCEAGLNKNGNKAARCLTIITERQKIGSPQLEELKNFFFDNFIPFLDIHEGSINIKDCDGIGESVG